MATNQTYTTDCATNLLYFYEAIVRRCDGKFNLTDDTYTKFATVLEIAQRVNASDAAAKARCELLAVVAPQIQGGQTRMARGQPYIDLYPSMGNFRGLPTAARGVSCEAPDDVSTDALIARYFAFAGVLERYDESVCAFHLSRGLGL